MKVDRRKIEAFKTWCWQRILNISWTERVTKEEVYQSIKEKQ